MHIRPRGLLGTWVKYNQNYLYLCPFFQELTYMSDASIDFHAGWLKRRGLAQGCAFLGIFFHISPQYWGVNRRFQAKLAKWKNVHIIKTTAPIPTKFCKVIKTSKCPSWVVPTRVKQIQDGGRPPSWKIENRPYLRNGSTDFREMWHDDVHSASELNRKLKFSTVKNPRWRTAAILKKWKIDHRTISINAKACSCQTCHTPSRQK